MYADDHQLFSVAKTANEAESILTEEGNNISEWYNNNLLQGNFSKYQVMSLGPRNWHKDLHIVINDTVIDQKPEITFLGVTLDDQLSFSSHVSNVCRKASSQTGVLLRLHSLIPTSAKLHIVKFAVLPHLTYCQTVWHFCRFSDARKLERIQERALPAVYCDNKSTYEELMNRANVPTLHTRRLQAIAILGCVSFGEPKNGFLILDLPDFAVERNVKSEIGFVTLVTFRQRVQYARQPLKNDVFSTV